MTETRRESLADINREFLGEFLDAQDAGQVPSQASREEVEILIEVVFPAIRREQIKRRAVERALQVLPEVGGSHRKAAERVGLEMAIPSESIRRWVAIASSIPTADFTPVAEPGDAGGEPSPGGTEWP